MSKHTSNTLRISVAGIELEHPVMNASGILGAEPEHIEILARAGFSAIVTKTFTREPRSGYPPPILVELESGGFLNAVGLANPGIQSVARLAEKARVLGKPLVVSIGGAPGDYPELAAIAEEAGASAVELNLSCPHVRGYGIELGSDPSTVREVVKNTASVVKIPVIAKLGLCDRIVESAGKALEAGSRALTLINTVKAMAIDVYSMKPVLSNKYGGLSGPPLKPIAIKVVYDVYREYKAEIIGCGGVSSWKDAAEFIVAGARSIQVGSAFLKNPGVVKDILEGLEKWLQVIGARSLEELVGAAHKS